MNVAEIITQKILEKLDKGVIPWQKPWNVPPAQNWKSGKPYTGINRLLLESGEYLTFNQCVEAGGRIKEGERANPVIFFTIKEEEDKETGKKKRWPVVRYYRVFKVSQCEGIESKLDGFQPLDFNPVDKAEEILAAYTDKPEIIHGGSRSYYTPMLDFVSLPEIKSFQSINGYYSTLFHELVHSTGHEKRLNREGVTELASAGVNRRGREELIAEIGAATLCNMAHIDTTLDNSASYIENWRNAISGDSRLIISAAQQAQKAVDYMTKQDSKTKE